MPTYEYKCVSCEEIFERFHKMTDPPMKKCPVCGSKVKKVISGGVGIIFKGSGFYTTDYKSASSSMKTSADDSSKSTGSGESGDKSATSTVESTSDKAS
jgi:putative FmdB family regulatory protein